jgi:glycosyltransferase involved in cell wall biosynthesis
LRESWKGSVGARHSFDCLRFDSSLTNASPLLASMAIPRVSVLIPAYNRAGYLLETVNSALNQTFTDLEVVIVDDGSTDNTAQVVGGIPDPRVNYLYQENRGVSAALNTAWRSARGKYLSMLGSDDVWLPNLLEELVPVLDADPNLGLVYARAQGMDAQGKPLSQILGAPEKFPGEPLESILYGDFVCGIAALFCRASLERVGGFDETMTGNEDWDLWIRLAEHYRFAFCDKILARYRMHPHSLTGGRSEAYTRIILDRIRLIENYYARTNVPAEALAIKPLARRNVYMDVTIRFLSIGQWRAAMPFFRRTVRVAPNPFTAVLRVLAVTLFDLYLSKTRWGVRLVEGLLARQRKMPT